MGGEPSEDWRVAIELGDGEGGSVITSRLRERSTLRAVRNDVGDSAAISANGTTIFAYAASRESAGQARDAIFKELGDASNSAKSQMSRWHPAEERWEDADESLPGDPAAVEREREKLRDAERDESHRIGTDAWQVHVEVPSREEAIKLEKQLELDGLEVVRRWRFLLVSAPSEADGRAIAGKISTLAADSSNVFVEGSEAMAQAATLSSNESRFAHFVRL
ncbi:MAG: hypothetical protein QM648_09405 [Solirubrobacterales bacterium]